MRLTLSLVFSLVLSSLAFAQPKLPPNLVAPTDALSPADERKAFTVPAGFDVQLVASEPDIQKPMQMAFDAKGRLWITTSYHYPFAATNGKPTDKLFILSDIDPKTGKAGKVQTFASDLNIPIGILPLPDCKSCIVSSVGEIRKYTDTDDDGKADKSEVLFTGFGSRDTHGMYNSYTLMPDGWVYACHGFANDSTVKGKDGHEVKMNSGHTFRFRPDGSRIEVYTRGQVNPFGMAVDPWFNLYTADCHSKPITQLVPGAYYESFGKPHDGLGFTPHVTAHPHKSTGLCGLAWYDADHFPKEYKGTMLLGDVVSNCVSHDKVVWKGSTPVAVEQPDFLTSKDRWFRPVDIKLGPDGAIYVADFYNKIIGHYEVDLKHPGRDKDRGRLWRIVWKGKGESGASATGVLPDFTKMKLAELIDASQNSPNIAVRALATQQSLHLLQTEQKLAPAAATATFLKLTALTTGAKESPEDSSEFRHAMLAARVFAAMPMWSDEDRKYAVARLAEKNAKLNRAVVEAVGFHPHADFIAPLVEVLQTCPAEDVLLKQAAKIALRNCLRDATDWPTTDDAILVEIALAIPKDRAAEYLAARIKAKSVSPDKLLGAIEHIARYGTVSQERELFKFAALPPNDEAALAAFRGVQARGAKLDAQSTKFLLETAQRAIVADFEGKLNVDDRKRALWGLRVLNAMPAVTVAEALKLDAGSIRSLADAVVHTKAPAVIRTGAAEVLLRYAPTEGVTVIRKQLTEPGTPETVRVGLLLVAAGSNVPEAQREASEAMKDLPYRVAVQVALNFASTRAGADNLFAAVKQGKLPQRVLQEKAILERLRASGVPFWDQHVASLTKGLPPADQRLAGVIKTRTNGFANAKVNKVEGAKLFTKHCAACHKIGDVGGKIAPQLDGIGLRGLERLLEDTLDPNRNVDQAFRARSITTNDDRTITALMLRVDGEVLVVADLEGKEQRIPTKDITQNRETMLSAMPANFADVIPEADFYHIIAYLLDQKAKEPPKK